MLSTNALRRSLRLQWSEYYTAEGSPHVSYKERLRRVFRRRRFHNFHNPLDPNDSHDSHDPHDPHDTHDTHDPHDSIASDDYMDEYQDVTDDEESTDEQTAGTKALFSSTWSGLMKAAFLLLVMLSFGILANVNLKLMEEVRSLRQQGNTPLADTMPNFASESQGARVLHSLSSDTYWHRNPHSWRVIDKIYHWYYSPLSQRRVIQGHSPLQPGHCWCFPGDHGHIVISLSHPTSITHVTMGHISKRISPYGNIASAPREFTVYGMRGDDQNIKLAKLVYEQDGPSLQTFEVPDKGVFTHVKLQIDSNWGNVDSTCLYNFRVHGQISTSPAIL
ncbi:sperm-associated antigen 4 protein-like [Acanthopagrus latus]|uniref:sperm-associated antigen 4 protein-like n=1 Tax=Acanthopagrus latus TaxID=8177 RepID=UPI00187BD6D3|nr:sperm-associated antigen 4 protein-like [Acanthopagrus latus]